MLAFAVIGYVLIDFSFNQARPQSYQFRLPELDTNTPVLLKQGNLIIIIAHYDQQSLSLINTEYLSATSDHSRDQSMPEHYQGYFVAMGYGTLSGCPIQIETTYLRESCSEARYDRLGRSLDKQRFPDLKVPQYTFNHDFSLLTIE